MNYTEIRPGDRLRPFIKCYYIYESASNATFEDTVFPSGNIEIIFNMGTGKWQVASGKDFATTPSVEFWGQIIRPLSIRSIGRNTMLGIRFYPHGAACILKDNIELFNDKVLDFKELYDNSVQSLHDTLLETQTWDKRISIIEDFLWTRLSSCKSKHSKIAVVSSIMNELSRDDFFDNIENVAARYGITSRYLQKLFLQYTGLTPKLYSKINRFQNSLRLIAQKNTSLTSIAYNCGYFDQSHFIRDFKSFTGTTPSGYTSEVSPITTAFANN
jgi:AraC-like DNA-binding protein